MQIQVLQILAAISLLPFLLVLLLSLAIFILLRDENYMKLSPQDKISVRFDEDTFSMMVSEIVRLLRLRTCTLALAMALIIVGLQAGHFLPEALVESKQFNVIVFLGGMVVGWLSLIGCRHYGKVIANNIIGVKPKGK